MDDGIDYSAIDPGIRDLCQAINAHEAFATLNSCQGHYHPEAVEESTRSGPAGPYVIFKHPDPAEDDAVARMLQGVVDAVQELDADATYHGGALVRQLYPGTEEAELYGRSSYTVTHPYRPSNVPQEWQKRFGDAGEAVEVVIDDGGCRGVDASTPDPNTELGDTTYCASIIDFQAFTDAAVGHDLETGTETVIEALEEERDHILDRLEEQVKAAGD